MSAPNDVASLADRRMKWYSNDPPNIKPETREVFEKYSKIPPDEVLPHVHDIRDKAWAVFNYPCIGQWRFLDLSIAKYASYPEVLARMRGGDQIFLDLGCAFAQDIRRLVYEGVDSSKCYGSDLRLDFMELGYDLFRDRDTLQSKFISGDVFDDNSPLKELDGKIDIIGTSSFFHLFDREKQKIVARRIVKLMKPQSGSLLVGKQVGSTEPHEASGRPHAGTRYQHNLESWRKLWDEIGEETGLKFQVDGEEKSTELPFRDICDIILHFSVRRL